MLSAGGASEARAAISDAFWTGNDLYHSFQSETLEAHRYVMGVTDSLWLMMEHGFIEKLFCTPENVEMGQVADVVKLFLEKNPAQRHKVAVQSVVLSLREAFPCS
jgi:hypothetical protein